MIGKLIGHLFTVVDISVNERDQHVISMSTAKVKCKVWIGCCSLINTYSMNINVLLESKHTM